MTPLRSSSVPELGRLLVLLVLGGLLSGCSDATGPEEERRLVPTRIPLPEE